VIPRGVDFVDDIGAAAPNPSNVFVTNLPGTINAVGLTLKSFHVTSPGDLDSLLVGPNGASAPTHGADAGLLFRSRRHWRIDSFYP